MGEQTKALLGTLFVVAVQTACSPGSILSENQAAADATTGATADAGDSDLENGLTGSVGQGATHTIDAAAETSSCSADKPGVYSPFSGNGPYSTGPVATFPWRSDPSDPSFPYPDGAEHFDGYGSDLPESIECGDTKDAYEFMDVTAGCLRAVAGNDNPSGQIELTPEGYFRALALGFSSQNPDLPVKWTDQTITYKFQHAGATGDVGDPGFKVFARYQSEYDLYVASWRFDGVVQIQRKECGTYKTLISKDFSPPSANEWHTLQFTAKGETLEFWIDGELMVSATDHDLAWGTAGIRIDSADGTLIDDWSMTTPQ